MSDSLVPRQAHRAASRVSRGETTRFTVDDQKGYLTTTTAPDGSLQDLTIRMAKQGSTLAGMMDALGQAISLGLRAGAPPEVFIGKFTNMRFTPAGITDDPELPIATSLMDYVARRMAVDHLPAQRRAEMGILTVAERRLGAGVEDVWTDLPGLAMSAPQETRLP
jgi:ribonucleoside-diphosphate reductase alpha chain